MKAGACSRRTPPRPAARHRYGPAMNPAHARPDAAIPVPAPAGTARPRHAPAPARHPGASAGSAGCLRCSGTRPCPGARDRHGHG
ncbi:hypothetical protein G6F68_021151 [Rhizopus microsporus]|nr:hypothetical protein G6F68_021151 [Rhizopus microsporus]